MGNSPSNDYSLPGMLRALPAAALLAELQGAAAAAQLQDSGSSGDLRVARFESAILQRTRTFTNWFWALNGAGNAHHRLCKYLGACSAAEIRRAALLQPIIESSLKLSDVGYQGLPLHHSAAAQDLMRCFGPLFW